MRVPGISANYSKHGAATNGKVTKTYNAWSHAKQRCFNPKTANYHNYGGRGITMCERWATSFAAFLGDMGEAPIGTSLDRIDVNGNYEPGNCRWVTQKVQQNNRRNNGHHKAACPKGHLYQGDNIYDNPRTGRRHCKECMRAASRAWKQKQKQVDKEITC